MLEIEKTLVSLRVLQTKFCCDVAHCLAACCIYGDSGAPLEAEEVEILRVQFPLIQPYLREEGALTINETGTSTIDQEGDTVTPLINGGECAYTVFDHGIAKCGIEKAFEDQVISFRKPVSCHLYPIRVKAYKHYDAVNFDDWDLCQSALVKGETDGIPVFRFVREALIRKFGQEWYDQLDYASTHLKPEPPY